MISYQIPAGSVDQSVVIRIVDSTDGTPETGVVFNTAGIDLQYRRELAASVAITEATLAALTTAHSDGGFLHIGNGYYRLDLPDAAVASGVSGCLVHGTVTGMVVIGCYINLTPVPADVRQFGGVAGTFSSGRPEVSAVTGDVGGNVVGSVASVTGAVGSVTGNVGGNLTGSVGSLGATAKADVNAELVDVMAVDTHPELGQMAPPASPTYLQVLMAQWKIMWNKLEQDKLPAGAQRLFNRAGTVVDQKTVLSDNGTTTTKDTWVSGP